MDSKGHDGSLDLADIVVKNSPDNFVPKLVEPEGNVNDKDDDPNG